ncbi:hypothetical protein [Priestia megaterium]
MSRNTLREAIQSLVHTNLLQTKQGEENFLCEYSRGAFNKEFSSQVY